MKLYHHYKNKPYKFIGTAVHSETLDEVVIYETLYDNPRGKLWVRPKDMFFESIEIENKTVPRFKKIPLTIESTTQILDEHIKLIAPISEKVFEEWDADWFFSNLNSHANFHLAIASVSGEVAGFKMGYARNKFEFYSWFGGVLPEYRGLGIATELMTAQHEWCQKQGYKRVRTESQNKYPEMLRLNIKNGFEIIGVHASSRGGMKIVMEKKLLGY